MFFTDRLFDVADFDERVSVVRRRDGTETTSGVDRAASSRREGSKTNENDDAPPRISCVWRFPASETTRSLRRGDRIRDVDENEWIVVDSTFSRSLATVSCRCVCEQLFPDANEKIDVYRLDSLNHTKAAVWNVNATCVAANVPTLVRRRVAKKERAASIPTAKTVDEISLWVKTTLSVETADVVLFPDGSKFETIAWAPPTAISDWGVLIARRIGGIGNVASWSVPEK